MIINLKYQEMQDVITTNYWQQNFHKKRKECVLILKINQVEPKRASSPYAPERTPWQADPLKGSNKKQSNQNKTRKKSEKRGPLPR